MPPPPGPPPPGGLWGDVPKPGTPPSLANPRPPISPVHVIPPGSSGGTVGGALGGAATVAVGAGAAADGIRVILPWRNAIDDASEGDWGEDPDDGGGNY